MTDDAYIYDSVDTLKACGIPIFDATEGLGTFTRMPVTRKPQLSLITLPEVIVVPVKPATAKKTVDGIQGADSKDYHRLSY